MPTTVGFDTATDDTAVAALRDGELLYASAVGASGDGRPAHATRLLAEVENAAAAAGGWEDVGRIAAGVGPGSFTGLRIGLATANALGQALGVEVVGVGTLAALARGATSAADGRAVLALLDARRGEVFAGLYDVAGAAVWEPFVSGPAELADRVGELSQPPLAVGSGAIRFRDELQKSGAGLPPDADPAHRVAAVHLCTAAESVATADRGPISPIYLRPPDAERWRERDSRHN